MTYAPEITIVWHPETTPIEGNALAAGDDEIDRQEYERIRNELESGNLWAWCCVEVQAEFRGLTGRAFLGCCSYDGEEDFRSNSDYFADLVAEATDDLRSQLADLQGCEIGEAASEHAVIRYSAD